MLVFAGTVFALRYFNIGDIFRAQSPESQAEIRLDNECRADADCVLVQDEWCKAVFAINKNEEAGWKEKNAKDAEVARQNRQTCELMPEEYARIENFNAICGQSGCVADFIK